MDLLDLDGSLLESLIVFAAMGFCIIQPTLDLFMILIGQLDFGRSFTGNHPDVLANQFRTIKTVHFTERPVAGFDQPGTFAIFGRVDDDHAIRRVVKYDLKAAFGFLYLCLQVG